MSRPEPAGPAGPPGRRHLLEAVADGVPLAPAGGYLRVGIDGVDGAGKTIFADELARVLRGRRRPVVRASVDGFHQLQAVRYRRGRHSPEGFWLDSYDYPRLVCALLAPFGPDGDGRHRRSVHDVRSERAVESPVEVAAPGSVLVVDGIFLHRDELVGHWDFSVFLDVPVEVTVARMAVRDRCPADPYHPANARYVGGQRLYLAACDPRSRASIVVDNTDPTHPRLVW